jgi:eukaryotic-like serine/threonine-protein kinase
MSLDVGTRLGSLEIIALIGKGGMGEVYRARDTKLKRDVAIKTLSDEFSYDPDRLSRFQREAELLASLNHPNIAAIYDLSGAEGSRFLVLELVEGRTLAERIQHGPIPVDEILTISKSICEALEVAHKRGIVHRDLKPANIKITPDGRVKVLDFGLAKAMESTPARTLSNSPTLLSVAASNAGVILGTAAYMSSEQAKGRPVDKRADIWAFGVVLYEMLTGRMLFSGETASETMAFVMTRDPDWSTLPANTPTRLRELLRRCLTKDPQNRLQAIGEARIAIHEILNNPRDEHVVITRSISRERFAWAAVFLFTVAFAVALVFLVRRLPSLPKCNWKSRRHQPRTHLPSPYHPMVPTWRLSRRVKAAHVCGCGLLALHRRSRWRVRKMLLFPFGLQIATPSASFHKTRSRPSISAVAQSKL